MTYRCEDAPCCGCGPEGCVDRTRSVHCKSCDREYHPDDHTETICYRCQATNELLYEAHRHGDYDFEFDPPDAGGELTKESV